MREKLALELRRTLLTTRLLLGRHGLLFALVDTLIISNLLIVAWVGGEKAMGFYIPLVVLPLVLIAVPALGDTVALERRAGCLDLSLSSPGGHLFFVRRVFAVSLLAAIQGVFLLCFIWFLIAPFPILLAAIQAGLLCALTASIVLFWAVRLKSSGGVAFASLTTLTLLGKWTFDNPIPDPIGEVSGWLIQPFPEILDWMRTNVVLGGAAIVFFLYARRRLDRPETMLT